MLPPGGGCALTHCPLVVTSAQKHNWMDILLSLISARRERLVFFTIRAQLNVLYFSNISTFNVTSAFKLTQIYTDNTFICWLSDYIWSSLGVGTVSEKKELCHPWLEMSWFPIITALGTSLFQCQFAVSQPYQTTGFFPAPTHSLPSKGHCVTGVVCEHRSHIRLAHLKQRTCQAGNRWDVMEEVHIEIYYSSKKIWSDSEPACLWMTYFSIFSVH